MKRPGYEADRQVLMIRDLATGQVRALTEAWDRSVGSIAWATDGRVALRHRRRRAGDARCSASMRQTGKVTRLTGEGHVSAVAVVPKGAVVAMNSLVAPDDYLHDLEAEAGAALDERQRR